VVTEDLKHVLAPLERFVTRRQCLSEHLHGVRGPRARLCICKTFCDLTTVLVGALGMVIVDREHVLAPLERFVIRRQSL